MSIKISWVNRNLREVDIEIYRSESPFDELAMPEAIATLPGTTEPPEYVDTHPKPGQEFYYATAVVDRATGAKVFSKSRKYKAAQHRGPGPQELMAGDEKFGFYGTVSILEMVPLSDLYPFISESENSKYTMCKFIRNNKILYVPDRPTLQRNNSSTAASLRIRSGVPTNKRAAVHPPGMYDDNIVTINNFKFHVRIAYVLPDDWTSDMEVPSSDDSDCEFKDLITALSPLSDQGLSKLALLPIQRTIHSIPYPIVGAESITKTSSGTALSVPIRGTVSNSTHPHVGYYPTYNDVNVLDAIRATLSVFPVLELIED